MIQVDGFIAINLLASLKCLGILRTSPIREYLEHSKVSFPPPADLGGHGIVEYHVLADGGFAQTPWMQRPYQQGQAMRDFKKAHFNKCFSS